MLISIVLPTLNEEQGIRKSLDSIPYVLLKKNGFDIEVIVVDGGSIDKTVRIAQGKGAKVLKTRAGYGHQYMIGFKYARGDIIVTADSDASYPLEEITSYINILTKDNLDFLTTNRFARMKRGSMRTINRIGNIFLTFFTNILFGLHLKDSQSGMWVFKKEILEKIVLTSWGMSFSEEIKIEAFKKLKAKEIPSTYFKRVGRVKLKIISDGVKNLLFLFKKRFLML